MSWLTVYSIFRSGVKWLLLLLLVTLSVSVLFYVNCTWYDFEDSRPFHGESYYNPYECVDLSRGLMSNFHAHSDCWSGLLNGYGTDQQVMEVYEKLGYDLFELSNYHQVSERSSSGLHSYEHGWGIGKVHQLVIGGSSICWIDFPLYQNIHQKQTILSQLREGNPQAVIVLAHPSLRGAYSASEISRLKGADCFEAINKLRKSKTLWDEVLSRGKYLSVIGSDDCHDIRKPSDIGRCGTYIFSQNPRPEVIKHSLKTGRNLAVEFLGKVDSGVEIKKESITKGIPLEAIRVIGDSIFVLSSEEFKAVRIIMDNSDTLLRRENVEDFGYPFPANATYTRMEFETNDGRILYTNPIIRSVSGRFTQESSVIVNPLKTGVYRFIIIFTVCLFWLFILVNRNEKISRKMYNRSFVYILYRRTITRATSYRRDLPRIGK